MNSRAASHDAVIDAVIVTVIDTVAPVSLPGRDASAPASALSLRGR